jgi:hypothetical protein
MLKCRRGAALRFDQLVILFTGVPAIFITQLGRPRLLKWAPVLGLLGQCGWFYAATHPLQIGILIVTLLYATAWGRGIYTHWIRPWRLAHASMHWLQNR